MSRSPRRRALGMALLGLAVGIAACVETNRPDPSACAAPSTTVELSLTDAALSPQDPAVCRGQQVELSVQSDVDGVLHIHAYDDQVPSIEVSAGERTEVTFDASRSGEFPIELHTDESAEGTSVGVLPVHEP